MTREIHTILAVLLGILLPISVSAADPTATDYTLSQCEGSAMPYPVPATSRVIPDSLTPVMLNHVGRHGARFYSSSKFTTSLGRALDRAAQSGTITPTGRELKKLCDKVIAVTAGRWGALDSLGMAEQRGIASRTHAAFPSLFSGTRISAISSYVPRCIASMDEFTHQLTRLDNKVEIYTSSGRQNNALMRPWTDDEDYKAYIASEEWHKVYDSYLDTHVPASVARKALGESYPFDGDEALDIAMDIYKVVSGCSSIGLSVDPLKFFDRAEYNSMWSVQNLHHYLTRSASTLSSAPMDCAAKLLADIIDSTRSAAEGKNEYAVMLRFGHAETVMPLLALMRLQGCYYVTNYFDTVGLHWRDFHVVPMASNIQFTLLRSTSGTLYLRVDLNETPVPLIPGRSEIDRKSVV